MKKKLGQTWSIDVIIAVIIFILIIAVFYALVSSKSENKVTDLKTEGQTISAKLRDENFNSKTGIMNNGIINLTKLEKLCKLNYEDAKVSLGIEDDFCIYIEDQEGNIIPIPCGGNNKAGIGNEDINISPTRRCNSDY